MFKTVQKKREKTFIMNSHRLFCLEDSTSIHMSKSKYCNDCNFMFGQAEIVVTRDRKLIINRGGKADHLRGDIEDGVWNIESYLVYEYKVQIQG